MQTGHQLYDADDANIDRLLSTNIVLLVAALSEVGLLESTKLRPFIWSNLYLRWNQHDGDQSNAYNYFHDSSIRSGVINRLPNICE